MARDLLVTIADLRGGRNGTDPPLSLPENMAVEVLNMDWKEGTIGRKRGGADLVVSSGGTAFTNFVREIGRHVPGATESAAELWANDGTIVKRLINATAWADVTLDDAMSDGLFLNGVSLNGKRFMAYPSAQARLHVYDPALASPRVRRVGIYQGATAPTVADSAVGGAVPAELAYWRVRFTQLNGSIVVRRSEPTPSRSFTPSGSKDNIVITRPTAPGEGETHWELEVSLDDAVWSVLYSGTTLAIATTVAGFAGAPSTAFPILNVSDLVGTYSLFPSVKYLLTDGNRLLGAGDWAGVTTSRIYFSPVLGSSDQGDDERAPNMTTQKNWIDLNEKDGGAITGLGGAIDGSVWVFKYRQIWKLTPTGDVSAPYTALKRTDGIGCVSHKSIVVGEDEAGRPSLYFMSHRGPYRVGSNGLQYLGRDNEDIWLTINREAVYVVAHAVWHADAHQVWFWVATGVGDYPNVKMIFDVKLGYVDGNGQVRGGWAKHTGNSASALCSTMFANTLGSGAMSRDFKPYIGPGLDATHVWKCDTTATSDAGTNFQASVTTKPLQASEPLHRRVGANEAHLLAKAQAATSVSVSLVLDFGKETRTATVSLAAEASETRVIRKVEGLEAAGAHFIQVTIGDAAAAATAWTLDALTVPVTMQEAG